MEVGINKMADEKINKYNTLIQVSKRTAKQIKDLRIAEKESYDEIIIRLLKK